MPQVAARGEELKGRRTKGARRCLVRWLVLQRLPRMEWKDAFCRSDGMCRVSLLRLAQLSSYPGKGFAQVGIDTLRVAKRRIEDGLHVASTLICQGKALHPSMSQEAFHLR